MSQKLSAEIENLIKQIARVEAKANIAPYRNQAIKKFVLDRKMSKIRKFLHYEKVRKLSKEESAQYSKLKRDIKKTLDKLPDILSERVKKAQKKLVILKKKLKKAVDEQNKKILAKETKRAAKAKESGKKILGSPELKKTIQKTSLKQFKKPGIITAAMLATAMSAAYVIQMRKEKKNLEEFKKKLNEKKK